MKSIKNQSEEKLVNRERNISKHLGVNRISYSKTNMEMDSITVNGFRKITEALIRKTLTKRDY